MVLASKLNHPAVLKELLSASAEVDVPDRGGFTALHYACIENRRKLVEMLVRVRLGLTLTPTLTLTLTLTRKLVEMLLEHGADPLIKTKAGDAPNQP